jgi:hypothetical protein
MKSNTVWWLIAAGVLLLGIWYWTNRPAAVPTVTPETTQEVMMEGEEGEVIQEDAVMEDDGGATEGGIKVF